MLKLRSEKGFSILIVDDNKGIVRRMTSLLHETGNINCVDTAGSYDEATNLLTKNPDIVFLDIRLPGKSGICLLKKIKGTMKECEVIMFTNQTGEYYHQLCTSLGARFFLDKTNDFELLPGIIKSMSN